MRALAVVASATLVAMAKLALGASVVLAVIHPCYLPNHGAWASLKAQTSIKGLTGNMDLVSATPHSSSTTITHPTQIAMVSASGDFVAIGTAKGAGTSDGITNCPSTGTSTRWAIYVDGVVFGSYFCRQGSYGSEPDTAANQVFEIKHTTCPGSGATVWVFWWNGDWKTCQEVDSTAGQPGVGGESLGYNPQDIDITYDDLQYRVLGGSYTDWYYSGEESCYDTGYSVSHNTAGTHWTMTH